MHRTYKLKSDLHWFVKNWDAEVLSGKFGLNHFDFMERVRQSIWLPQMIALPERERVSILRDAFVTNPPKHSNSNEIYPQPVTACLIGMVCLDTQEAREGLFIKTLTETSSGGWIYAAIKPLGPIRTIDLIFHTVRDPLMLAVVLQGFAHTLLPNVVSEDREAVKQHYMKYDIAAREQYRPFSSAEELEEYERILDKILESRIR